MTIAPVRDLLATPTDLVAALHQHGVLAGRLMARMGTLHQTYVDESRVFIKVASAGERHMLQRELDGTELARARHIPAPIPVLGAPIAVGDQWATAWGHLRPCTPPPLAARVAKAVDQMAEVSAAGDGSEPGFDLDYHHHRVNWATGDPEMLRRATAAFETIDAELDASSFTWIHGDVHLGNQLWLICGGSVLVDWEFHAHGPIEWDVAQLLRSVLVTLPGYHRDERLRCARLALDLADSAFAPNWRLVEAIIAARNVTGRTRQPAGHDHRRAVELDPILDAGLVDSLRR